MDRGFYSHRTGRAICGQERNFRNYLKIYENKLSDGIALNKPETL